MKTVHLLNLVTTTLNLLEISQRHAENSVHLYNKFWAKQKINYKNHLIFFNLLFFASVLSQFQEIINITVPRLQIYGKGTRPLVASLIYIPGCGIVHTQHWNKTIWDSIGLVKKEIKIGKSLQQKFWLFHSTEKGFSLYFISVKITFSYLYGQSEQWYYIYSIINFPTLNKHPPWVRSAKF